MTLVAPSESRQEIAPAAQRLVERCEQQARASEPIQESIARLLDIYDTTSPASRRGLYEQALFLQYGLLLQVAGDDQEVLRESQARLNT